MLGSSLALLTLLSAICVAVHVPRLAANIRPQSTEAPPVSPATFAVSVIDATITLSGTLPDESTKRKLIGEAQKIFGSDKTVDKLRVDAEVSRPDWVSQALALLPVIKGRINNGGILLSHRVVVVRGDVVNEDSKTKLLRNVFNITGSELTVNDQLSVVSSNLATVSPSTRLQIRINDEMQGKTIDFATASAIIKPHSKTLLDEIAAMLQKDSGAKVEIAGHTDAKGDARTNIKLSQRRADAVLKYLVGKGIDSSRLNAVGYGSTKPIADESTAEGQQQNRRIEFRVQE